MSKVILACFLIIFSIMVAACTMPAAAPTPVSTPVLAPVSEPTPTLTPQPTPAPTATPQTAPAIVPISVPPFIARIGVWHAEGEFLGSASTFLVDREKRLFVTNAHITEGDLSGKFFRIHIDGVWYPAHTEEVWINWFADTAIFRLEAPEDLMLPASARLGDASSKDSDVRIIGYLPDSELAHLPDAPLVPYFANASVVRRDSKWTVTFDALAERALLMDEFVASLPEGTVNFEIPREMRAFYYRHFVLVELKELIYDQRFRPGTSGMPLLTEGGEEVKGMISGYADVLGIFFGTGGSEALAIPVEEIKRLHDKVIGMLK